MGYFRKDNRNAEFTIAADAAAVSNVQLQCSGMEPVMMSVTGGDVVMSYTAGGTGPTLVDGTVVTWGANEGNPFADQVYFSTVATSSEATVKFLITGGIQGDIQRI